MGRAFSIHTAAGMLGNAVAPITIVLLLSVTNWQTALIICGIMGGLISLLIAANADAFQETLPQTHERQKTSTQSGLRLLFSRPILLGALFFLGIGIAGHGISAFGVATLTVIHDITVTDAAAILSAYLFASPLGVLCGGWIADRIRRHVGVIRNNDFVGHRPIRFAKVQAG